MNVASLTQSLFEASSDRPFVTMWAPSRSPQQETVTFAEFLDLSQAFAGLFQERGVQSTDTVILIMSQGIALMAAFAGAMLIGAVPTILAVPTFKIDPEKYRHGLSGVTRNIAARLVVIDADFPENLRTLIALNGQAELLQVGSHPPIRGARIRRHEASPDDVAFIQHSAGTTGLQKGVALSHRAVLNQLPHLAERLKLNNHDRIVSWLPLYHDMGLIACFILPLVFRLHVVMQSPTDWVLQPVSMLQLVTEHACTLCWLPNFAFQFLSRRVLEEDRRNLNLSSFRAIINCSEPVRPQSLEIFRRTYEPWGLSPTALHSSYAMAENTFAVTQTRVDGRSSIKTIRTDGDSLWNHATIKEVNSQEPGDVLLASSGACLPNNVLRVVDSNGKQLPDGTLGELLIRSDSLFRGYYNRPDLTEKVLQGGWYSSRDVGFSLDGEVFVLGRRDDTIIVAGRNLYPQDIEETVFQHPAVHPGRVVAFGIYSPEIGTNELAVIAEVNDEADLQRAADIERDIHRLVMSEFGVAARWVYIAPPKWIIKSSAGKPARSTTRQKFLAEHPEINFSAS